MSRQNKKDPGRPTKDLSNKDNNTSTVPTQDELWKQVSAIALDPKLKETIRERIRSMGYAGSTIPVEANILMLTSRLLERPMNGANISQSSSGKTKALDTALAFFPKDAYYKIDAGSERVLIYTPESFEHKMIIFSEADSLPEDGPGAAALRAIISDNKMVYEYVTKAKKKGNEKFVTERIEKKGPTGCITTSTKHLPKQIATRMLTLTIDDSAEQTRAVMLAIADEINGAHKEVDCDDFRQYQQYISLYGDHGVVVPIARELALRIPSDQVRMRRDFKQFIIAIQVSALLHQIQRARDNEGRIIATCDDYAYIVEVFGELFQELATDSVPPHIRDTVTAVEFLGGHDKAVTVPELMKSLSIKSRSTINERVKVALKMELLIDEREHYTHPHKLRIGRPLPEETKILPAVEEITTCLHQGCSIHPDSDSTGEQAVLPSS